MSGALPYSAWAGVSPRAQAYNGIALGRSSPHEVPLPRRPHPHMSDAPGRTSAASLSPLDREDLHIRRHERSIGSLVSLLVHILFVLALLYSSKMTLAPPEGSASGGARGKVDFIGETPQDDQRIPVPPAAAIIACCCR